MTDRMVQGWNVENTPAGYWTCGKCEYMFTIVTSFKDNGQEKADVYKSCNGHEEQEYIIAYEKADEEGDYVSSLVLWLLFAYYIKDTRGWE